jgi:hypothetical protein
LTAQEQRSNGDPFIHPSDYVVWTFFKTFISYEKLKGLQADIQSQAAHTDLE